MPCDLLTSSKDSLLLPWNDIIRVYLVFGLCQTVHAILNSDAEAGFRWWKLQAPLSHWLRPFDRSISRLNGNSCCKDYCIFLVISVASLLILDVGLHSELFVSYLRESHKYILQTGWLHLSRSLPSGNAHAVVLYIHVGSITWSSLRAQDATFLPRPHSKMSAVPVSATDTWRRHFCFRIWLAWSRSVWNTCFVLATEYLHNYMPPIPLSRLYHGCQNNTCNYYLLTVMPWTRQFIRLYTMPVLTSPDHPYCVDVGQSTWPKHG